MLCRIAWFACLLDHFDTCIGHQGHQAICRLGRDTKKNRVRVGFRVEAQFDSNICFLQKWAIHPKFMMIIMATDLLYSLHRPHVLEESHSNVPVAVPVCGAEISGLDAFGRPSWCGRGLPVTQPETSEEPGVGGENTRRAFLGTTRPGKR